jgi:hypothetical protein
VQFEDGNQEMFPNLRYLPIPEVKSDFATNFAICRWGPVNPRICAVATTEELLNLCAGALLRKKYLSKYSLHST